MSRSAGPTLLERSEDAGELTGPAQLPGRFGRKRSAAPAGGPEDASDAPTDGPAAEPTAAPTPAGDGTEAAPPRRRLPRPPGRRGPLWLAALIAGALAAATPGLLGESPAAPVSVNAADYGLGHDVGLTGEMEDVGVRQGISEAEAQARLSELAASRAAREPQFVRPVDARMTTCYCMRWGSMHTGVDLAAPLGTDIYAVTDGVVLRAGPASGFGYAIWIKDEWGNVQVYGHMRYIYVEAGQTVQAGDRISVVGNEGQSTGPHLHYEIRRGSMSGRTIDVEAWLSERGITY